MAIEISVILNLHREGLLSAATISSIEDAIDNANANGIKSEVICVLDRCDDQTQEVASAAEARNKGWQVINVDEGDLGLARNAGVRRAKGRWVAFIDGDDLWGREWLSRAHSAASSDPRTVVWHSEVNLYFGVRPHLFLHVDMEDPIFDIAALALTNLWTALCFVERTLMLTIPYRQTNLSLQLGYEDWDWAIQSIHAGAVHKIVPLTCHAIRTKKVSLVQETASAGCLPKGGGLFRQGVESRVQDLNTEGFLFKVGF
ncbi:glycosyltransferase family 2 protein [Ensifer sp. MJa1]|uniref:glycosyltransferase family 2 protein n=1 Tax=Ensifer sp. MJa1 TaxID=2919888 RepID=UPI0030095ECA